MRMNQRACAREPRTHAQIAHTVLYGPLEERRHGNWVVDVRTAARLLSSSAHLFLCVPLLLCMNPGVLCRLCSSAGCWYYFASLTVSMACLIAIRTKNIEKYSESHFATNTLYIFAFTCELIVVLPLMDAAPPRLLGQRVRAIAYGITATIFMCVHKPA